MTRTRDRLRGALLLGIAGLVLLTPVPLPAQPVTTLKGHTDPVTSVAFSPDGKRIVSGSDDKTVKVWDAHTGQEIRTLKGHTNWVLSVAFSADGKRIASGSADQTVKVWDAATGTLIAWRPFESEIRALWFDPETRQLRVADNGGTTGRPRVYVLEIIRPDSSRP